MNPEDSSDEADDLPWETNTTNDNKAAVASEPKVGKTDDISKAFDDLFTD